MRYEVLTNLTQFRSPQLLLVSGIGPKSQLDALHIPIVADRPGVGKNIQVCSACCYSTRHLALT